MSTGTEVIRAALRKIGAYSIASPDDPESIILGRDTLNSMIQEWETVGIKLGCVPLNAPGDELSEPLDARNGIVENLALRMYPDFPMKADLAVLSRHARVSMIFIKKFYQPITIPKPIPSSTMPMGAGNVRSTFEDTFAGTGQTIDA